MAKYKVSQGAYVYFDVVIEAENEAQARELGAELIMDGQGVEDPASFEWQDDTYVVEVK